MNKYIAEFIGTAMLALVVNLSIAGQFPVPTPVLAALTVAVCVYTMGAISGTHINPAVTIALAVVKQIGVKDASFYLVAQFAGGIAACATAEAMFRRGAVTAADSGVTFGAEALGAFILMFGISAVVFGEAPSQTAGLTIGGSLLAGISVAAAGSNGVLNPAVALSIGSVSASYLLGPLAGAIIAALLYRFIASEGSI